MPLLSAPRRTAQLAPPLQINNQSFNNAGLKLRQGQFSLLAAAPGVGKSLVATNIALRLNTGVLYFSADTDEWTVRQRACSVLTGAKLTETEKNLEDPAWDEFFLTKLRAADHIDWCYRTDIEMEFIVDRLFAYAELRHEWPALVVVDNLGDMVVDQDNEGSELRSACRELKRVARTTKAHVMGLCHVNGPKENGDKPIGLGDLIQKIGKVPEVVLGMHREDGAVQLSVPKQRGGKSGIQFPLPVDYTTATVGGFSTKRLEAA